MLKLNRKRRLADASRLKRPVGHQSPEDAKSNGRVLSIVFHCHRPKFSGERLNEYAKELEVIPGSTDINATLRNDAMEFKQRLTRLARKKKTLSDLIKHSNLAEFA